MASSAISCYQKGISLAAHPRRLMESGGVSPATAQHRGQEKQAHPHQNQARAQENLTRSQEKKRREKPTEKVHFGLYSGSPRHDWCPHRNHPVARLTSHPPTWRTLPWPSRFLKDFIA
jgi:hypothetical protein